jgi:hypothetical protein
MAKNMLLLLLVLTVVGIITALELENKNKHEALGTSILRQRVRFRMGMKNLIHKNKYVQVTDLCSSPEASTNNIPSGSFHESCINCCTVGDWLSCLCGTGAGAEADWASIVYSNCVSDSITNDDGRLICTEKS